MEELEELEELKDLYDEFIGTLDSDFQEYLSSIKYVATIDADNIDKAEINTQIANIVKFVEYRTTHYEISKIEGFKVREKLSESDYYYYLADQKAKALVYYTRYLNFLDHCKNNDKEINKYQECKDYLDTEDAKLKYNEYDIEYNKKVCDDLIKRAKLMSEKPERRKYFMFNNNMREIEFYGASFEFLWDWNTSKKTIFSAKPLYRKLNFTGGNREFKGKCDDWVKVQTNQKYIENMFTEVVSHLNNSKCLHSFTENGLLDVFKYLYPYKVTIADVDQDDKHKGYYEIDEHNQTEYQAEFRIIKNANINNIFGDFGNEKNTPFQEFIDSKNIELYKDLGFTLEIYPPPKAGDDTNEKEGIKGIKEKLINYLKLWVDDVQLIMSYVADDKEVISTGKCFTEAFRLTDDNEEKLVKVIENDYVEYTKTKLDDSEKVVDIKNLFSNAEDGTLFSMSLTVKDMIYLLMKIYEIKLGYQYNNDEEKIYEELLNIYKEDYFMENSNKQVIYKTTEVDELVLYTLKELDFERYIELKNSYFATIFKEPHPKSDFILTTLNLEKDDFKFVNLYNQYKLNSEVHEVHIDTIILKEIIFKKVQIVNDIRRQDDERNKN